MLFNHENQILPIKGNFIPIELTDWNVRGFVPSILKDAKHNGSEGCRELKRVTVLSMCRTTINTINPIFTCLLWFTITVIAFKNLKSLVSNTAQIHKEYLHRLGTSDIFGFQGPWGIQRVGTNPGHGREAHICSNGRHSTFTSTGLGNNGLLHHLKLLINAISFVKIHYSIKNSGFDQN